VEFIKASRGRRFPLVITDPRPVTKVETIWRTAAQAATIGIFVIALGAAVDYSRPILLPIISAFMLAIMLGPLTSLAGRFGVPSVVSAAVLWLLSVAVFYGIIVSLSVPIVDSLDKGPQLAAAIKQKLHLLDRPLSALQDLQKALLPNTPDSTMTFSFISVLRPAVTIVTPAIGQMVIFFGTLFFALLGRRQMRRSMIAFFDGRDARLRTLRILNDVESNLTSYLSVVAVINLGVGIAACAIAFAAGLPNPLAWGVLGFILNFVPYLGALLMELIFFAVGLLSFPTLGQALLAPLAYLAVATLEGHFITPSIMGYRLLLNPLVVFLALVFWSWMWGPIGALLAVPLLIVMLVVINHLFPKDEAPLPS